MKNIFKTVKGKKFFSAVLICFVVGGLTMSVFYLSNGKSFDDRSMASDRQLPAEYEKADLNGDKKVSMEDFGIWVKLFRSYKNDHTTFDSKGDLNGDKKISMEDFREWLLLWRRYKGGEFPINELIISSISTGVNHTCGLGSDGNAYCWGDNGGGRLGTGDDTASSNLPKLVVQGDRVAGVTFSSIFPGFYHTCGLDSDGNAYCWGDNSYGQLGTGDDTTSYNLPKLVVRGDRGSGVTFSSISTGFYHTCGLGSDGNAYCWGYNGQGLLGTGDDTTSYNLPKLVVRGDRGSGVTFSSISTGGYHTCGLDSDGNAYCWGRNDYGQLGTGDDTASYNIPKLIVKVGVPVIAELPELLVSLSFNGNITNKVAEVKFVSKDSTGNKAPTFVQGKEGEAVFFDGNKDSKYRISYDDEDPLLFAVTSFTIMAYVKKDEGTCNYGRCTIFSKGNSDWQGYSLYLNNARKLTLRLNDKNEGEVSSVEALEDNKWYHVASTYNGTTREIKLYIDGVLSATSVYGEDINYGNASAMIGNGNSNLDLPFRGAIDEVRFFTTPLSEKEIRTYLLP